MGAFFLDVGALAWLGRHFDGPTETSPAIRVSDPVRRAVRLKFARAAWKAGRGRLTEQEIDWFAEGLVRGMTPKGFADWQARQSTQGLVVVNPNAATPTRRLVYGHPMRPPHLE